MEFKKPVNYYMRALHRDIGFFVIGLTIIYCISGIMLTYRETGFLKQEKTIERHLPPNIEEQKLGMILHLRDFKILKAEGDVIYFQNGTFNKSTGIANYSGKSLPLVLEKFNSLHKSSTQSMVHWFSVVYGILLLFLAISSFWMYKPGSRMFHRGIIIAGSGFTGAVILLFL
jgi:hypothetical protein